MTEAHKPANERGQWMALTAALLGWMFDGAEMSLFSLVGRPALRDLLSHRKDITEGDIGFWFGAVIASFLVGAATGGVLFGWLGDRIGRVRAMSLSVLTYALFTGACGLAQNAESVFVLRFIASLGMGGEWALGVSLVMEIWPNRSRALLAGLIGAAANVGYLLVAILGLGLAPVLEEIKHILLNIGVSESWASQLVAHQGWRILMIMGAMPALLTFLIRLFVPESEKWEEENEKGTTSNWATVDLLGVIIGGLGPAGIVYLWSNKSLPLGVQLTGSVFGLFIALVGYTYPVLRYLQRVHTGGAESQYHIRKTLGRMFLGAGLSGVALLGTWGSLQWIPSWADQLTGGTDPSAKAWVQVWSACGAISGTIIAALAGDWLGRKVTYLILCVTSLISMLSIYGFCTEYNLQLLVMTFIGAFFSAAFYGWLPLYLPELFPTNVRATCQGFGFNFGRIFAAIGTLQIGTLLGYFGSYPKACSIASAVYLIGPFLLLFAPETKGKPLPD